MPRCISSQSELLRLEGVVWIIGRAIIVRKINVGMCSVTRSCPTLCNPHGLQSARLLCPWGFPGKNTGVGCHSLLQMWYKDTLFSSVGRRLSCKTLSVLKYFLARGG